MLEEMNLFSMQSNLDLRSEEIFPYVNVYKGLIPDVAYIFESIQYHEHNPDWPAWFEPWSDWYGFGSITRHDNPDTSKVENEPFQVSLQKNICHRIQEIRLAAISHYIGKYDVPYLNNMDIQRSVNFAKYDVGKTFDETGELVMLYHTDFQVMDIEKESQNFLLTCNIYINDDYEGGDLRFMYNGLIIKYKPSVGDVVVFPSGSPYFPGGQPYFHAVDKVEGKPKYLSRNYLMYDHKPPTDWDENVPIGAKYPEHNQLVVRGTVFEVNWLVNRYYSEYKIKDINLSS